MRIRPGMGGWQEGRDLGIRRGSVCRHLHQWRDEESLGVWGLNYTCLKTTAPPETILKRLSVCDIYPFIEGEMRAAAGSDSSWCDLLRSPPPFKAAFSEATFVVVKNFSYPFLWKGGRQKRILITERDTMFTFELVLPCKCLIICPWIFSIFLSCLPRY